MTGSGPHPRKPRPTRKAAAHPERPAAGQAGGPSEQQVQGGPSPHSLGRLLGGVGTWESHGRTLSCTVTTLWLPGGHCSLPSLCSVPSAWLGEQASLRPFRSLPEASEGDTSVEQDAGALGCAWSPLRNALVAAAQVSRAPRPRPPADPPSSCRPLPPRTSTPGLGSGAQCRVAPPLQAALSEGGHGRASGGPHSHRSGASLPWSQSDIGFGPRRCAVARPREPRQALRGQRADRPRGPRFKTDAQPRRFRGARAAPEGAAPVLPSRRAFRSSVLRRGAHPAWGTEEGGAPGWSGTRRAVPQRLTCRHRGRGAGGGLRGFEGRPPWGVELSSGPCLLICLSEGTSGAQTNKEGRQKRWEGDRETTGGGGGDVGQGKGPGLRRGQGSRPRHAEGQWRRQLGGGHGRVRPAEPGR